MNLDNDNTTLMVCGSLAGMVGTLVSMPCDVARTRIVAQSFKKVNLKSQKL